MRVDGVVAALDDELDDVAAAAQLAQVVEAREELELLEQPACQFVPADANSLDADLVLGQDADHLEVAKGESVLESVDGEEGLRRRLPRILVQLGQALDDLAQELVLGEELLALRVDEHRREERAREAHPFVVRLTG